MTWKHRLLITVFSLIVVVSCFMQLRFHPDRNASIQMICSGGIQGHLSFEKGKSLGYTGISRAARKNGSTLLLDMGDALCCSMVAETDEGAAVIRIMNKAGYGAMVPGAQDFAYGITTLKKLRSEAAFPFLAANIRDAGGKCLFEEYRILTINHVKIGIVGVTDGLDEKTAERENLTIEDPSDTVSRVIASMGSRADAMIVMAYLADSDELDQIAQIERTSIVFAPAGEEGEIKEESGKALVAVPGQAGSSIITVDLDVRRDEAQIRTRLMNASEGTEDERNDSPVAEAVEEAYGSFESMGSQALGYVDMKEAPKEKTKEGDEDSQDQTEENAAETEESEPETELYTYHINETAIGNLTADAMLWQGSPAGARAALIQDREIRGSLFTGTVTRADVCALFEDDCYLVICSMTGGQLRSILEDAFKGYPKASGFLQLSGITCTFTSKTDIGSPLSDIQIDGGKLEDAASYTVIMTDSLAKKYGITSTASGRIQVMRSLGGTLSQYITQSGLRREMVKEEPETDEDGDPVYRPKEEETEEAPRIRIR